MEIMNTYSKKPMVCLSERAITNWAPKAAAPRIAKMFPLRFSDPRFTPPLPMIRLPTIHRTMATRVFLPMRSLSTAQAKTAAKTGLVVTSITLLATVVSFRDLIQKRK